MLRSNFNSLTYTIQKEFMDSIYNKFLKSRKMELKVKQTVSYLQKMDKAVFSKVLKNVFACQCGKFYNAFPALYLHFQRSHKIKISTKLGNQFCSINKVGNTRTFTYFISKQHYENHKGKNQQSVIFSLLNDFISSICNEWDKFPAYYLCSTLLKYLVEEKIIEGHSSEMNTIHILPTYFNDFLTKKGPMMKNTETYQYNCSILLALGQWLNIQGHSNIKLEYNTLENNELNSQKQTQSETECKGKNTISI